ncbi:MAG: AAA family ATPase [Lachnospiraceae bacterium]|nr:AAA family ATPase [Lachnospiraceae bacterium]
MARTIGVGIQSFDKIVEENYFYIDKTFFIKEWWESGDDVTLITRPRRFGKTLNMSMVEQFFSIDYAERAELFEGLSIWEEEKYHNLQGTYPVISLSFARVKETTYAATKEKICEILRNLYIKYSFLKESDVLTDADRMFFERMLVTDIRENDATSALYQLSNYLYRYYGKKVIILLDEYDTPMQEAYVRGFWEELVSFTRSLFNSAFKTNPYMDRGIMTGITRVSKESIFPDLNNLEVVTTTSEKYATSFGFTEEEVFTALDEYDLGQEREGVKAWYDGFVFGNHKDIYNPWSILNFLDKRNYATYWANTSNNSLVGKLIREGNKDIKSTFEALLRGEIIRCPIDEQIVYDQLDDDDTAIWSLLIASGYLKVLTYEKQTATGFGRERMYDLCLTNGEVVDMFYSMVRGWFRPAKSNYSDFVSALLCGDVETMNVYMNEITMEIFSYFDTERKPSRNPAEQFYHGFVLGMIVELREKYMITSNRESGFGRYDVMLEPREADKDAIILEFKVYNSNKEKNLEETVAVALKQIEEKQYEAVLAAKGIPKERIRKYGFAFEGKKVLIG